MTDIDDLGHNTDAERVEPDVETTNSTVQMVTPEGEVTIMEQGKPTQWISAKQGSHVGIKDSEHLDTRLEGML